MQRQKHKVLVVWPEFNNGPVGRMDYFVSYLGVIGICLAGFLVGAVAMDGAGDLGAAVGGLLILGLSIWIIAHSIALVYKRFWDVGFEDAGTRTGMTVGYYVVGIVPLLGFIAGLALLFWPRKEEEVKVEA